MIMPINMSARIIILKLEKSKNVELYASAAAALWQAGLCIRYVSADGAVMGEIRRRDVAKHRCWHSRRHFSAARCNLIAHINFIMANVIIAIRRYNVTMASRRPWQRAHARLLCRKSSTSVAAREMIDGLQRLNKPIRRQLRRAAVMATWPRQPCEGCRKNRYVGNSMSNNPLRQETHAAALCCRGD